ncbi:MAG: hypothetical protein OXP66_15815 [Candidatus Tectomicrobia bacterium]|nr:hypothetical protein [Candidatus Tectomicrobia bacterium]
MTKGALLAFMLAVLTCVGCGGSDRDTPGYDLTGTWDTVNAACMSEATPGDLDLPSDLPPEALEEVRRLVDPANWESEIEGTVRVVQTGDMLEIFDSEETPPFFGTVTGSRLEYSLSQDGLSIEGEGDIVSPDRLKIGHVITFEVGPVVSCQFDVVRL